MSDYLVAWLQLDTNNNSQLLSKQLSKLMFFVVLLTMLPAIQSVKYFCRSRSGFVGLLNVIKNKCNLFFLYDQNKRKNLNSPDFHSFDRIVNNVPARFQSEDKYILLYTIITIITKKSVCLKIKRFLDLIYGEGI